MWQLPAIFKSNGLLEKPDFNLTQIVRQEEDNAIVKVATMARNGQPIPTGNYGNVIVLNKNMITEAQMRNLLLKADQILAGTNRTCYKINNMVKQYLGMDLNKLNIDEKIICRVNNWDVTLDDLCEYSLVNGIIGNVTKIKSIDEKNKTWYSFI